MWNGTLAMRYCGVSWAPLKSVSGRGTRNAATGNQIVFFFLNKKFSSFLLEEQLLIIFIPHFILRLDHGLFAGLISGANHDRNSGRLEGQAMAR